VKDIFDLPKNWHQVLWHFQNDINDKKVATYCRIESQETEEDPRRKETDQSRALGWLLIEKTDSQDCGFASQIIYAGKNKAKKSQDKTAPAGQDGGNSGIGVYLVRDYQNLDKNFAKYEDYAEESEHSAHSGRPIAQGEAVLLIPATGEMKSHERILGDTGTLIADQESGIYSPAVFAMNGEAIDERLNAGLQTFWNVRKDLTNNSVLCWNMQEGSNGIAAGNGYMWWRGFEGLSISPFHEWGPFKFGEKVDDKHWHTDNEDGEPINSLHFSKSRTFFHESQREDAPNLYEGETKDPGGIFDIWQKIFHFYYDDMKHPFKTKSQDGYYIWVGTLPIDVEEPPPIKPVETPGKTFKKLQGIKDLIGIPEGLINREVDRNYHLPYSDTVKVESNKQFNTRNSPQNVSFPCLQFTGQIPNKYSGEEGYNWKELAAKKMNRKEFLEDLYSWNKNLIYQSEDYQQEFVAGLLKAEHYKKTKYSRPFICSVDAVASVNTVSNKYIFNYTNEPQSADNAFKRGTASGTIAIYPPEKSNHWDSGSLSLSTLNWGYYKTVRLGWFDSLKDTATLTNIKSVYFLPNEVAGELNLDLYFYTTGAQRYGVFRSYSARHEIIDNQNCTFIGIDTGLNRNTGARYNVGIGDWVMDAGLTATADFNTGTGTSSLSGLTSGAQNSAGGYGSFFSLSTGSYNTGWGVGTGFNNNGSYNSFYGNRAGYNCTGSYNLFAGNNAGFYQAAVSNYIIIDTIQRANAADELVKAPFYAITNAAIASQWTRMNVARLEVTDQNDNLFIGEDAGLNRNSGAQYNTGVGKNVMDVGASCTADYCTVIGYNAGSALTSGSYNTFYGAKSGQTATNSEYNTLIGYNVNGLSIPSSNGRNTGVGMSALAKNQGYYNTAVGYGAMYSAGTLTGRENSAFGYASLYNLDASSNYNSAYGSWSGRGITTGDYNSHYGNRTGYSGNVSYSAYYGNYAGYYETASYKLFIDTLDRGSEANQRAQALLYGYFNATAANQFLTVNGYGAWGSGSAADSDKTFIIDRDFSASTGNIGSELYVTGQITPEDDDNVYHSYFHPGGIIQGGGITTSLMASVKIDEPNITRGSGSSITEAASLVIQDAPSEATTNYGLLLQNGARVYNDLYMSMDSGKLPGANQPTWKAFRGNIFAYTFGVGDYIYLDAREVSHAWDEGTDLEVHVHIVLDGSDVNDRDVNYEVEYCWGDVDEVFSVANIITSGDYTIPGGTADRTHLLIPIDTINGANYKIGSMLKVRFRRIALTGGGTAPTNDPFVLKVGFHCLEDSIGSRGLYSKN